MSFINGFAQRMAPKLNQYSDPRYLLKQQEQTQDEAGAQGKTATDNYLARALAFDPSIAINTYAQGAWGAAKEGMDKELSGIAGSAAGGRINTGFFDEDRGNIYKDTLRNFGNSVAQTAVQGVGMQLQNNTGLGEFGQNQQNRYTDLLMSRRQEVENAKREAEARKRQSRGRFASLLGTGLGMVAGSALPGIGSAIGAKVGGYIGSRW